MEGSCGRRKKGSLIWSGCCCYMPKEKVAAAAEGGIGVYAVSLEPLLMLQVLY